MSGNSGQNYINHIALVLDASGSMSRHEDSLIKVADEQIAYLAQRSKELDQETRVTVYTFDDTVSCKIYEKDVLRLPSIKEHYRIGGMTALIDATMTSQLDLALQPEKYGDHSFLTFVLTDGLENRSRTYRANELAHRLEKMPENWTVAVLVPDQRSKHEAKQFGFPADNIAIWDADSEHGIQEAVKVIRTATDSFMDGRTRGVRGTRSLFVGGNVNAAAVKAANLSPLPTSDRQIVIVTKTKDAFEKPVKPVTKSRLKPEMGWFVEIEKFVNLAHPPFRVGKAYYELVKTEKIQGDKEIAVVDVNTNKVYVGAGARQLLGLPEEIRTVKPEANGQYRIYVQSSSLNRHLPIGSHVLLLTK